MAAGWPPYVVRIWTVTPAVLGVSKRLATAIRELEQAEAFDHVVVNDDLQRASSQVAAIIEASRSDPRSETTEEPFA